MTDVNSTPSGSDPQQQPQAQNPYPGYQATYHHAEHSPSANTQGVPGAQHYYASQAAPAAQPVTPGQPASPSYAAQPKKGSMGKTFLVAFAGALLACVLAFGVWGAFGLLGDDGASSDEGGTSLGASTSSPIDASDTDSTLPEAVAAKCLPSVVSVDVYTNAASSNGFGFGYGYGFGYGSGSDADSGELTQSSAGSGVVLSADGYIITNYHVVEGGAGYKVTIEGEVYDAELVGSDPSSDIAVLKAKDASGLTPIEIGDSDNLTIGEWVMSIGNPFGLEQSVATGIVSATNRSQILDSNSSGETTIYTNMIQTDAAINPGNSGGALVDADGKLIGINTLITSYSGNYSGVGFAIPVNYAVQLAEQIIDGKTPTHAQLGVSLATINSSIAKRYGFAVSEGAYVSAVSAGSGAEAAGIQVGDIVTAFDGQAVEGASDLMLDVRSKNPGDVVTLTLNRDGQTQEVQVTLGSDESSATSQQSSSSLLDMLRGNSGNGDAA